MHHLRVMTCILRANAKSASVSAALDALGVGSVAEVADGSAGFEAPAVVVAGVGAAVVIVDVAGGLTTAFIFSITSAVCCVSCWFIITCKDWFSKFHHKFKVFR